MDFEGASIISVTAFRRGLTTHLDRLKSGATEKIVVIKNGEVECVVMAAPAYERLKESE